MDLEERSKNKTSVVRIIIFSVILLICLAALGLIIFCRQLFGDEIGDLILGAGVENGFVAVGNFFIEHINSIISTLIVISVILVISCILYIITNLIFRGTPRKRTIASLLKSLIRYSKVCTVEELESLDRITCDFVREKYCNGRLLVESETTS